MSEFQHQRHKSPTRLERERPLILVCAPLRSNVNLSRLARTAGCSGVRRMIACGNPKLDRKIARVDPEEIAFETHRSLVPVLQRLGEQGYERVGLEQTTGSESLYTFQFVARTVLVVGNERLGLTADILEQVDRVVEIPVYGQPQSYNVSTAAAMALYEYCRQFPLG